MATHMHITRTGTTPHRAESAQALEWLATRLGWERTLDALRRGAPGEREVPHAA